MAKWVSFLLISGRTPSKNYNMLWIPEKGFNLLMEKYVMKKTQKWPIRKHQLMFVNTNRNIYCLNKSVYKFRFHQKLAFASKYCWHRTRLRPKCLNHAKDLRFIMSRPGRLSFAFSKVWQEIENLNRRNVCGPGLKCQWSDDSQGGQ